MMNEKDLRYGDIVYSKCDDITGKCNCIRVFKNSIFPIGVNNGDEKRYCCVNRFCNNGAILIFRPEEEVYIEIRGIK